jgi:hypothetical protein
VIIFSRCKIRIKMQKRIVIKIVLSIIVFLVICYQSNIIEKFTDPVTTTPPDPTTVADPDAIQQVIINEYTTVDGGVTVSWPRPDMLMDYMALIKDEEGSDEIKMFFKDNSGSECNDEKCTYTFQNLVNQRRYSIAIAGVTNKGIGDLSNKVYFTPTFQTMKCNANGTCTLVPSDIPDTLEGKIERITADSDVNREVLAKCHNILDKNEGTHDINRIYDAGGQFKKVKDALQYPEHLLLPIEKGPNSLEELVKHQLELGIVNVNVHNKDLIAS